MKQSIIVICTILIAAAHGGIAAAQPPEDAAYRCAMSCERELGHTCHDRRAVTECLERQPECTGNPELVNAAGMILFGRMTCPQVPVPERPRPRPRVRQRRQTPPEVVVVAPAQTAPETAATQPVPTRELPPLTYVLPALPIIAEGPVTDTELARRAEHACVELGGVWYAEGRTADPSRARMVQMIENLVVPNAGPPGSPSDDQTPGVCLTPEGVIFERVIREILLQMRTGHTEQAMQIEQLYQQLEDLRALRQELEDLRARVALNAENAIERDLLLDTTIDRWARHFSRLRAQSRCRPGQATIEFVWDGVTEVIPCQTPEARMRATASGDDTVAATSEPSDERRQRLQIPGRRRGAASASSPRLLTGDRLGLGIEFSYGMTRYQQVAHEGSTSPKSVLFGVVLTVRLADHFYLLGGVNAGVGLRDGEHVPALAQVNYRFGVLGVAAGHLLLGASAHFGHRYSGNGELAEQSGTWYQLRHRGLRLDVGYILAESGWAPYFAASAMLGVGCHADRRLNEGEQCLFDPGFMITIGGMRLRAP